jgi:hypothetical protein
MDEYPRVEPETQGTGNLAAPRFAEPICAHLKV